MKGSLFFQLISIWVVLSSCSDNGCRDVDEAEIEQVKINLVRHDKNNDLQKSDIEVLDFLRNNPTLRDEFLGGQQYPNDSTLARTLHRRLTHPEFETLRQESDRVFGDLSELVEELEKAFTRLKYYYPDTKVPRVETMLTGFGSSEMYVSDSLIIIGLDYYLGSDATYRPSDYPQYILRRFEKEYIVPAVILLQADQYSNVDPSNRTMMADMIFYGKKYFLAQNVLPCTPDSLIIWYTEEELEDVNDNQHIIWANFVENQILYESDHETKERFLGERPNTYEISAACPGRVGAWVGWEIVKKYADEYPDKSVQEIMADPDAQKIFTESGYKGRSPDLL